MSNRSEKLRKSKWCKVHSIINCQPCEKYRLTIGRRIPYNTLWIKIYRVFLMGDWKINIFSVNLTIQRILAFDWYEMPEVLRCMFFLHRNCLSVALTGYRNCPLGTDAVWYLQGALRISDKISQYPATGANSHPCSYAPRWHVHVPALPETDEILSAPNSYINASALQRTVLISC